MKVKRFYLFENKEDKKIDINYENCLNIVEDLNDFDSKFKIGKIGKVLFILTKDTILYQKNYTLHKL
jgi:hypothetical protein